MPPSSKLRSAASCCWRRPRPVFQFAPTNSISGRHSSLELMLTNRPRCTMPAPGAGPYSAVIGVPRSYTCWAGRRICLKVGSCNIAMLDGAGRGWMEGQ